MRRLLREPLLHFLALGALLFGLHALVAPAPTEGERILISAAAVEDIRAQHQRLWNRAPDDAELRSLIETRVRDEILYREGVALRLDRDDALIKRRVRQKLELMAEEADSAAPSEAELEAYLAAHPEAFRNAPTLSFRQVLVPVDGASARLRELQAGANPTRIGKPTLLPFEVRNMPQDTVARDFGAGFAEALAAQPAGAWIGPVASAYGVHLVRIDARSQAVLPTLEQVHAQVRREWENARRQNSREARYAELRRRYEVVVEGGPP